MKWADFAASSTEVLLATGASDARIGEDSLLIWDPKANRVRSEQSTGSAHPLAVIATAAGIFVAGSNRDLLVPVSGKPREIERIAGSEALALLALSPDHHLLARAFRREVQLYDAESAALIGPPLQSDSGAMDVIAQLAFSPDGSKLLGRTAHGHWLLWPIAVEPRPVAKLDKWLAQVSIERENQKALYMPEPSERLELRARDPGPWLAVEQRPVPKLQASAQAKVDIPMREPGLSPLLLDLGRQYDFAPDAVRNSYYNILPSMRPLPVGTQRIAGVDFDVRGMMQLGGLDQLGHMNSASKISCLPLPQIPVAALRLLLSISVPTPTRTGSQLAALTLHYVDGGTVLLPIRAGQEVRGFAGNDLNVPLAFSASMAPSLFGYEDDVFSAPRLRNPQPQRLIRCLDLKGNVSNEPMLLLAITAEPANAVARSGPVPRSN